MATIKSYTDIEQSRKLAEILPIESADMYYILMPDGTYNHFPLNGRKTELVENTDIPCWSLAALLDVLSLPDLIQDKVDGELFWQCSVYDEDGNSLCETYDNNPVDVCVAMIEKLHELNLL